MSEITDSLSTPDFSIPEDWRQELPGVGMFFDNISSDYKRKTNVSYLISYIQYHGIIHFKFLVDDGWLV